MSQTRRDFLKKTAALTAASYVGMTLPVDHSCVHNLHILTSQLLTPGADSLSLTGQPTMPAVVCGKAADSAISCLGTGW